jgi:hypothetical protein
MPFSIVGGMCFLLSAFMLCGCTAIHKPSSPSLTEMPLEKRIEASPEPDRLKAAAEQIGRKYWVTLLLMACPKPEPATAGGCIVISRGAPVTIKDVANGETAKSKNDIFYRVATGDNWSGWALKEELTNNTSDQSPNRRLHFDSNRAPA